MRPSALLLCALAAAACAPASPVLSEPERAELVAEVQAATDSLTAALQAHDVERILGFIDLDGAFVYASCTEFLYGAGLYANITGSYHAARKDVTYEFRVTSTRVLGPQTAVVTLESDSSEPTASNPVLTTNVLAKGADGRWRVAYQHQSWPGCPPPKAPHPMTTAPDEGSPAQADSIG